MSVHFSLRDEVVVKAPIERCFLLSTSLSIVEQELRMKPVHGRTTGLVVAGDTIRWEGRQLGLPQFHESLIENFRPPVFFTDRMIDGRFRHFEHDHSFRDEGGGMVRLCDEVRFSMRWGRLGNFLGKRVLAPHIQGLLKRRFARLKRIAESEEWRNFIPGGALPAQ